LLLKDFVYCVFLSHVIEGCALQGFGNIHLAEPCRFLCVPIYRIPD